MPPWCGLDFFFLQRGKGKAARAWKGEGNRERKMANGKKQRVTTLDLKGADFPAQGFRACLGSSLMST